MAERRALRIPLAVRRSGHRAVRRFGLLLPLIAVAALVRRRCWPAATSPTREPRALAPPDTALVRARPEAATRCWALAAALPVAARRWSSSATCGPGSGTSWPSRVPAAGGDPLLIAEVARPRRRRALPRAARRGRPAFAGDFLRRRRRAPRADGPSLADTPVYRARRRARSARRSSSTRPRPGCARALENAPAALRAAGAFAEAPHFAGPGRAPCARQSGGAARSARASLRAAGAPPAPGVRARPPGPRAGQRRRLPRRAGRRRAGDAARARRRRRPGRPVSAPRCPGSRGSTSTATCSARSAPRPPSRSRARGATPVFTLTARTDNPALTREALARLQEPLAEQLTGDGRAASGRSTTTRSRCPSPARSSPRTRSTATS